ncbi:MAG: DUF1566 domain-containing protein [Desulfofustis sp.]|nr:DUF1566 domain-containing protein [Desulfofustis sp.]NNK13068.1 DUF1566 domain-containing protein [Desulfofustis sp.]
MGMFHKIKVGDKVIESIDWEMTPELTFGTYESWGGRERVRNNDERIYYFFIDNWGEKPKLCLMERAVKHARIIAEIQAPTELVSSCVDSQGEVAFYDRSFAINDKIRTWLIDHVLDDGDSSLVTPLTERASHEDMGTKLPTWEGTLDDHELIALPSEARELSDDDVREILVTHDFADGALNPSGNFANRLQQYGQHIIVDQRTGLMWQRGGLDITSTRLMNKKINDLNRQGHLGYHDWRLPSLEEAMSLMESNANDKDIHLNSNFSKEQPFIFTSAQRTPGGYWFVDYKHGRLFWSSGTIPGGFGRLCRTI